MARVSRFGGESSLRFFCPGCENNHGVQIAPHPYAWGFNGDFERPTFTPSILVTYDGADAGQVRDGRRRAPAARCHSFITNGRIQFLADSTHAMSEQTVDLPELP